MDEKIDYDNNIMELLKRLEEKLQCTLKCMIKLAMENTSK